MKLNASSPRRSFFVTAAIVFAVAAACLQLIFAAPYVGIGLAIAQAGEVWGQRLLPGNFKVRFVEPLWLDEVSLFGDGRLCYINGRTEQGLLSYWICPTNAVYTLVLGTMLTAAHLVICGVTARLARRDADREEGNGFALRLSRWSALWCGLGYCLYQFLRWFWAGAHRGDITQRVVGEKIALIAFGPFGRTVLLLGAIIMYGVLIGWTARYLTQSRSRRERIVLLSLTAVVVVLLMFPYWSGWALPVLGPNRFGAISDWARESPLRDTLGVLAPAP